MRIPRQPALPRWSGILVEPRVDRVLQKFNIELADLLEPAGALEARLVRSQLPDEAVRALQSLRAAFESGYETLARSAAEIDPTLTRPVQGAKNQALAGAEGHREEAGAASQAPAGDRAGTDRQGPRAGACRTTSRRNGS